jgi:hypothetical protein
LLVERTAPEVTHAFDAAAGAVVAEAKDGVTAARRQSSSGDRAGTSAAVSDDANARNSVGDMP